MIPLRIRRLLSSSTVDAVVRIFVVLSLVGGGFLALQNRHLAEQNRDQAKRTEDLARCVATYNNANNQRSEILTKANEEERAAERAADDAQAALFLSPILSKPAADRTSAEQAEVLRLFRAYQHALSKQREERAAADDARRIHPIPDPPSEVCG